MLKSYIAPKITTITVFILFLFWLFSFYKTFFFLLIIYIALYVLLRKNRNHFLDDPISTKGVIFSPANGRIIHIEPSVSHSMFGEQLIEIQIMVPWWRENGIFLPLSAEIKNLLVVKGQSFFRYKKADKVLGSKEGRGVHLRLDNKGESVGVTFYKCILGFWPELIVMPGDRGSRRVNIGFFPLGGTVMLYLPKKYEILLQINDEVSAGESILAMVQENN